MDGDVNSLADSGSGNGLTFDAGFEADYILKMNGNTTDLFFDMTDLGNGTKAFLGSITPGSSGTLTDDLEAALNNSNTSGVAAGSGTDDGSGVATGVELKIPYGLIGNPTGPIKVCLVLTDSGVTTMANQTLPGLGGSANLGDPQDVDLGSETGDQFVSIVNNGGVGLSYELVDAFPGLTFNDPVAILTPPGETNRIFVVQRAGVIQVVSDLASPTASTFLDIDPLVTGGTSGNDERGLLGLAFHPGYETNGYFYVFYTGDATTTAGGGLHDIVSRFQVSSTNINVANSSSELRLILQRDQASNHNGGYIAFGPADGYLYIGVGDEGGANDNLNNSQLIDKDLFAGILRIDVDNRPGSLAPNPHPAVTSNYRIPADNPYIGATSFNGNAVTPANVRTEFFAVGLRNPWRKFNLCWTLPSTAMFLP